jgi:hypothetical protein
MMKSALQRFTTLLTPLLTPLLCTLASCALLSCGEAGQSRVSVPLYASGVELSEPIEARGGVTLTLTRAELAFGALYLCAGVSAGDLCESARLEWLDSAVIDTLDPTPQTLGTLTGVSGSVRSWMYDLGLSSQLTAEEPFVLEASKELGGYSFILEGVAELDGARASFSARVKIQQSDDTELGVPVIRKSSAERFEHEVDAEESGLLLKFDPRPWLSGLDLNSYLSGVACEEVPCEPSELTFEITSPSEAHRALRIALLTRGRPTFTWGYTP